jgi:hypothetical protein
MKIDVGVQKEYFIDRKWCNKSIQGALQKEYFLDRK